MAEIVNFPGNDRQTAAFEQYVRRCGRPDPTSGEPCAEPAGHTHAHQTAPDAFGMSTGWWDNPPSVNSKPEPQ